MPNISELEFKRIIDASVFPFFPALRKLFEQIDGLDNEAIDQIYKLMSSILTIPIFYQGKLIRIPNPCVWFVLLSDPEHKIKGLLWFEINIIERCIFIQALSIDRQYQSANDAASKVITDYLFNLPNLDKKYKSKIVMANSHPKASEKYGWKRCKRILMEISNNEPTSKQPEPDTGMVGQATAENK